MTPDVISVAEPGTDDRSNLEPPQGSRYIRFGPFQVDQQREEVTRNGSRLKFQGKVYQVLIALLEKPGEVVTRDELRQRLWSADTHVNFDANVNVIPSSRSRSFPIRRSCLQLCLLPGNPRPRRLPSKPPKDQRRWPQASGSPLA